MKDQFTEIIDSHIFETNSEPSESLEEKIIEELLSYVKNMNLHIPIRYKNSLIEDFRLEIRQKCRT